MSTLASIIGILRDLALIAAAVAIVKWVWDQVRPSPARRDAEARVDIEADKLRALAEEQAERERQGELRELQKIRVHRILQQTDEPYLSFAKLKLACAAIEQGKEPDATMKNLTDDGLRRLLIELIADEIVSQTNEDEYFVRTEYEDEFDNDEPERRR